MFLVMPRLTSLLISFSCSKQFNVAKMFIIDLVMS